jgi:hypothetical protein
MHTFTSRMDVLPAEQRQVLRLLGPTRSMGFVLYGGTAIALRLGHRQSVDFDFFSSRPLDKEAIRKSLPFIARATTLQDRPDTLTVLTKSNVKVSFFGSINFGHVEEPEQTNDRLVCVASLPDLLATKLKVLQQRVEAKDYEDVAAMLRAGVGLGVGLAAAAKMFAPAFQPAEALKALTHFQGGDLQRLSTKEKQSLIQAASAVRQLPAVTLRSDLGLEAGAFVQSQMPPAYTQSQPSTAVTKKPRQGPRMSI